MAPPSQQTHPRTTDRALQSRATSFNNHMPTHASRPHIRPDHPGIRPVETQETCSDEGETLASRTAVVLHVDDKLEHGDDQLAPVVHAMTTPSNKSHLLDLPADVLGQIISSLSQGEQAALMGSCKSLYAATFPYLYRMFRCVNCAAELFPPSDLRAVPKSRLRNKLTFLELRGPSTDLSDEETERWLASLHVRLDTQRGAANFHVLRHLARTMYASERFPLPKELAAVRALRCASCEVFVGFCKAHTHFIHVDFLELVDIKGTPRALSGATRRPRGPVECSKCSAALFDRDDILPWTHVLASSRLTDFDAYLEWDHSWGGPASAAHPAFFVKRLRPRSFVTTHPRIEHCRQGPMRLADVTCARCSAHIGWQFLAECAPPDQPLLTNYDQVGRFGIIRNALTPSEPRTA